MYFTFLDVCFPACFWRGFLSRVHRVKREEWTRGRVRCTMEKSLWATVLDPAPVVQFDVGQDTSLGIDCEKRHEVPGVLRKFVNPEVTCPLCV